eukprot:6619082-Prymnesium_polylepis.2
MATGGYNALNTALRYRGGAPRTGCVSVLPPEPPSVAYQTVSNMPSQKPANTEVSLNPYQGAEQTSCSRLRQIPALVTYQSTYVACITQLQFLTILSETVKRVLRSKLASQAGLRGLGTHMMLGTTTRLKGRRLDLARGCHASYCRTSTGRRATMVRGRHTATTYQSSHRH